jgi:choline dehydrogenase-like flavoprotein
MLWSISEEIPLILKGGKKRKVGFIYLILGCKGWGYHDVLPYFKKA